MKVVPPVKNEGKVESEEEKFISLLDSDVLEERHLEGETTRVSLFKLFKELLKQIKPGVSVVNLAMPMILFSPITQLEKSIEGVKPITTTKNEEVEDRFLKLLKWVLFNYQTFYKKGLKAARPLDPILGEFFKCKWHHEEDDSVTYFVSECVSVTPYISTLYLINPKRGFLYEADWETCPSLSLSGICLKLVGKSIISLLKYGEVYEIVFPDTVVKSLIFGKIVNYEFLGKLDMRCEKNGMFCLLEFNSKSKRYFKGFVGKETDGVRKNLYKIDGIHDGLINITDLGKEKKSVFMDNSKEVKALPKVVKSVKDQGGMESRKLWYTCSREIYFKKYPNANVEKSKIEDVFKKKYKKEKYSSKFFENIENQKENTGKGKPTYVLKREYADDNKICSEF